MKQNNDNGVAARNKHLFFVSRLLLLLLLMRGSDAFVVVQQHRLCRSMSIAAAQRTHNPSDEQSEAIVSRRSVLLSSSTTASLLLTLSTLMEPLKVLAVTDDATVVTPISASWKSIDGLNVMKENSKGTFVGFDDKAYQAMINDESRTPQFYQAMEDRITKGGAKSVLDLGTGPYAIFAIKAAELGATTVYAIEANPAAAALARATIRKKGFETVITVLEGFSTDISLPNNDKVDLIVAEVIGSVASEESVVATIFDAHQRFAKNPTDDASWIPSRVQTYAAPASYTLHNLFKPPAFDWSKLNGEPVRFDCRDEGLQLLADPQIVEDIQFSDIVSYNSNNNNKQKVLEFTVDDTRINNNTKRLVGELQRNQLGISEATTVAIATGSSFSGIAFWPRLLLSETGIINSRQYPNGGHQKSHWQTVLPIMKDEPIPVNSQTVIQVTTNFNVPSGSSSQDLKTPSIYKLDGTVTTSSTSS